MHRSSLHLSLCILLGSCFCLTGHAQFGEHVQYFSQVGIGGGATTFFTIHNPSNEGIVVLLEIYSSDGSNAGYDRDVGLEPGATITIDIAGDDQLRAGWARLSSAGLFNSTVFFQIVLGQIELPRVGVLPSRPSEKTKLFAFISPTTNTGIAIANPSASVGARLILRRFDNGGQLLETVELDLEPLEHLAQFLNEDRYFPGLTDFEGIIEIEATRPVITLMLRSDSNQLATLAVLLPQSTGDVGPGTITEDFIADGAISNTKIRDGAVSASKIADGAVGLSHLAPETSFGRVVPGDGGPQDAPNLILGHPANGTTKGTNGATIGGGGRTNFPNTASGNWSTIGGRLSNTVSGQGATIGGGALNVASADTSTVGGGSTIGGGSENEASGDDSTVSGGSKNRSIGLRAAAGGGGNNLANGTASTVAGGENNTTVNGWASVGGGESNRAAALHSTVGGGQGNNAASGWATIGGGEDNAARDSWTTVGGGQGNAARSEGSTIAGGVDNAIDDSEFDTAENSTIGGGSQNRVNFRFGTVSGGENNTTASAHSTVGGGRNNRAGGGSDSPSLGVGGDATVGGGWGNIAAEVASTIGGGLLNQTLAESSTVGGGRQNTTSGFSATVGGGRGNTAFGDYSTVGGGDQNATSGDGSTVGGGSENAAADNEATVGGGRNNTASGPRGTVGGGFGNTASGDYSVIPGGVSNEATGFLSFAAGRGALALHDQSFVWSAAEDETSTFESTAPNQFLIQAANGVGININTPEGALDVDGLIYHRGGVKNADYVFEDDYQLESIEEHSEAMWREKHLPAVGPGEKDGEGREFVEYGSRMRGMLEELEKAHIYIERLHNRNKSLEARLQDVERLVAEFVEKRGN